MRAVKIGLTLFLIFTFLCCSSQKSEWKGTVEVVDGVTVVKNPKEPLYPEDTLRIEEELSIGGPKTKDYIFSDIFGLFVDDDENIYVVDSKEACVMVFDKQGNYIKMIGKKGQGPGEFGFPRDVDILPNNDIVVLDSVNRRISLFSDSGIFKMGIPYVEANLVSIEVASTGTIVGKDIVRDEGPGRHEIKTFTSSFEYIASIDSAPMQDMNNLNPFMPNLMFSLDAKDRIIYGYPSSYEFKVYTIDGNLIKKISRQYVPLEIKDEEKQRLSDLPPGLKVSVPKYHSPYWNFFVDDDCRIYALTWEKSPDGENRYFDVFDEEGRYIAKVPLKSRSQLIKKNKLYSIEQDAEGYLWVKRYRVIWDF